MKASRSLGFFLVVTSLETSLAVDLDDSSWNAVQALNTDHLEQVGGRSAWSARATMFAGFVNIVKASRASKTTS